MKQIFKWNFKTKQYEKVEIEDDCSGFEIEMDTIIRCPHCKKRIKFGDGFASHRYHNKYGFGFAVCRKCYDEEVKEMLNSESMWSDKQ